MATCVDDSNHSTHTPVMVTITDNPRSRETLRLGVPKEFPKHDPIGPRRAPRVWPRLDYSRLPDPKQRLEATYSHYITNVELDLCEAYDIVDEKSKEAYIGRASPPHGL